MSIRPIDMQIMIPKATEIGNAQQLELQRPTNEQLQFQEQLQKNLTQNQQQVIKSEKADKALIRERDKNKKENPKENSKQNKKDHSKSDDENNNSKTKKSTSLFDVKI